MPARGQWVRGGILAALAGSALCLALAPLGLPEGYSVMEHTTSTSAAQGVEGAWVARLGFLLLGFAVLTLTLHAPERWGAIAPWLHRLFGIGMVATAAFAERSWREELPYDAFEDSLHSIASGVVGFSFIVGVLAIVIVALRAERSPRLFDLVAVGAAMAITVALSMFEDVAGVLQRSMFAVAYAWYGVEAWRAGTT